MWLFIYQVCLSPQHFSRLLAAWEVAPSTEHWRCVVLRSDSEPTKSGKCTWLHPSTWYLDRTRHERQPWWITSCELLVEAHNTTLMFLTVNNVIIERWRDTEQRLYVRPGTGHQSCKYLKHTHIHTHTHTLTHTYPFIFLNHRSALLSSCFSLRENTQSVSQSVCEDLSTMCLYIPRYGLWRQRWTKINLNHSDVNCSWNNTPVVLCGGVFQANVRPSHEAKTVRSQVPSSGSQSAV